MTWILHTMDELTNSDMDISNQQTMDERTNNTTGMDKQTVLYTGIGQGNQIGL